MEIQTISTEI